MSSAGYEAIVTTQDKPTLVLAGPGAGKTFLLGDRVKRLLERASPRKITVLTFGRDASQHMRNKLLDPEGGFGVPHDRLPAISTLHALGLQIIQDRPRGVGLRKTGLSVQEDNNVKHLLYRDAALIVGLSEREAHTARKCKEHGDCIKNSKDPKCSVCKKYWEIMSKCNRVDFDDQVLFACNLLEENPGLLAEHQSRAEHLLLDEYQDINAAQFRLIELLSRRSRNGLFAVGDDAQSIYQFRGADPSFILRFRKDFPGASTPPLAQSWRCHVNTIRLAERVLEKYYPDWRGPQELEFHVPAGEQPSIWQVPSDLAEAKCAARLARKAVAERKTVLILAPKKEFFPAISKALRQYSVPHECPANLLPNAVDRRLNVLLYLAEWVNNSEDSFLTRLAIETLIDNGPARVPGGRRSRRCSPETLRNRVQVESEIAFLWEEVSRKRNFLAAFLNLRSPLRPIEVIQEVLDGLLESFGNSKGNLKAEFVKRLSLATDVWTDPAKLIEDLSAIKHLVNAPRPSGFGSVQLMTMRKAKGLEADVVVMVGLEDDIMPSPLSTVEEEARLFYVSMTRAKEQLYMIHSYKRPRDISFGPKILDKKRSRFLDALGRRSEYLKTDSRTS